MGVLPCQLPVLMAVLVALLSLHVSWSPVEACSCAMSHPQEHFCRATWVIKAKVKTNRIIKEENDRSTRLFGVKISRVFKEHSDFTNGGFVRIYTPDNGGMCGVNLMVNFTYVLQGGYSNGRPTINLCDDPQMWYRISPVIQKGYRYLYEKNCQCSIGKCYPGFLGDCANDCSLSQSMPWRERQCYTDHGVCTVDNSINEISADPAKQVPCTWSKRGLFYRCMAQTKKGDKPFDWEP